MQTPEPRLRLGIVDWESPVWIREHYPEDMPPEWRLAHYATGCDTVLVPAARWRTAAPAELVAWVDDTPARFRFLLEAADDGGSVEVGACCRALGPRCGGVVGGGPPGLRSWSRDRIWRPGGAAGTGCSLGRIQVPAAPGLRWLGDRMKAFVAQAPAQEPDWYLLFEGPGAGPELLHNAAVIAGMLGV